MNKPKKQKKPQKRTVEQWILERIKIERKMKKDLLSFAKREKIIMDFIDKETEKLDWADNDAIYLETMCLTNIKIEQFIFEELTDRDIEEYRKSKTREIIKEFLSQ
jgi:hypothetical protein